jgi:uncharacterized membrane protein
MLVSAFIWGALFGVTVYSVYDLTNRATLRRWPLKLVFIDILWGGVICGNATVAATLVNKMIA